jgi:Skp family chaperone for outer membrane proteins
MKRINTVAVSLVFAAIFAVSALAQAPAAAKIGWIDTGMFADDKEGVTKYMNALKALDAEMKPRVTELQGLQTRIQNIAKEISTMTNTPAGVPVNNTAIAAKQEEGQKLQRGFEYKKKEYDAAVESGQGKHLGPVSADISKAIQEFAKQKGYSVILDIDKLGQAGVLLALDQTANITKEFITFYNARPATTATTATPRP